MSVLDASLEPFESAPESERTVLSGFGCTGQLHLGHLPVVWVYRRFRSRAADGQLMISDTGAYLSRDVDWDAVCRYRRGIEDTLARFGLDEESVRESDRFPTLLSRTSSEAIPSGDLGVSLTVAAAADALDRSSACLLVVGEDERKFVRAARRVARRRDGALAWIVLEDIPSPDGDEKMSKSRPWTCRHLDSILDGDAPDGDAYRGYLEEYFEGLGNALGIDVPAHDGGDLTDVVEAVRRG